MARLKLRKQNNAHIVSDRWYFMSIYFFSFKLFYGHAHRALGRITVADTRYTFHWWHSCVSARLDSILFIFIYFCILFVFFLNRHYLRMNGDDGWLVIRSFTSSYCCTTRCSKKKTDGFCFVFVVDVFENDYCEESVIMRWNEKIREKIIWLRLSHVGWKSRLHVDSEKRFVGFNCGLLVGGGHRALEAVIDGNRLLGFWVFIALWISAAAGPAK